MRKPIAVLFLVFAVAFVVGVVGTADAGPCFYKCICSVPHKCCTSGGVTTCKPAPDGPLQCTQVQNC